MLISAIFTGRCAGGPVELRAPVKNRFIGPETRVLARQECHVAALVGCKELDPVVFADGISTVDGEWDQRITTKLKKQR